MGDTRNYAALDWVIGEIGETLKDARQSLEAYVEDPRDSARIRFCLTHIHQVHGSLQMVEFHGASLFAEEMESLAEAVMHGDVVNEKEAQEALMRSLLQLPLYLDQVKALHDDHPGAILPLLNDLRAVRKQSYLSETNLFTPDLSSIESVRGERHAILSDAKKLKQVFKKLREMYQHAAASVLRGIKVEENLGYIEKVLVRLESVVRGTACHPTWQIGAGLIEALIREDVELSIAVRGLLRQLAHEIKVLEDNCPEALDAPIKEGLLRNMLYYVARAENTGGVRVAQVKLQYSLEQALLLGGESSNIQMGKGMVSPPEPDAIKAVVLALQDELNTVKHLLDLALTEHAISDIEEMLPIVKRIADTLAVMGIGDMRKEVGAQYEVLAHMCEVGSFSDSDLIELAGGLAKIENRLDAISKGAGKTADYTVVDEKEIEIDAAKDAVIAECRTGIESVKDAIVDYMSSKWNPEHLSEAATTLYKAQGGLAMIPLPRSAAVLKVCAQYIKTELMLNEAIPSDSLTALAETIASVDYYLERLADGHGDDLEMYLDLAEEGLEALGYSSADTIAVEKAEADDLEGSAVVPASELIEAPDHIDDLELVNLDITSEEIESENLDDVVLQVDEPQTEEEEDEDEIDEEIIEIFVEEAGEVQETLEEYVPKWSSNLGDQEALATIRRSFHTLKGSGRMVAAMDVGELAWAIENMLNRVVDDTVAAQDIHITLIERALTLVPPLIEAFQSKQPNPSPAKSELYIKWANEMAQGIVPDVASEDASLEEAISSETADTEETDTEAVTEESITEEAGTDDVVDEAIVDGVIDEEIVAESVPSNEIITEEGDEDEDQTLWEIFASEALTHLAVLDEFVAEMDEAAPIYTWPTDSLQRALHTLKGSAHMAAIKPVASLITPLETFAKELRGYQVKIDNDILQLFKDSGEYTREGLACIYNKEKVVIAKEEQFIARVKELSDIHVAPLIHLKEQGVGEDSSVDPRMLYAFMAKDMNLLLDADLALDRWSREPEAVQAEIPALIAELKTLSEGALFANLPEMSVASDHLHAIYTRIVSSELNFDENLLDALKPAHHGLLDMMDQVAAGQNVSGISDELLESLFAFSASNDVVDDDEEQAASMDFDDYQLEQEGDFEVIDISDFDESSIEEGAVEGVSEDDISEPWDIADLERAESAIETTEDDFAEEAVETLEVVETLETVEAELEPTTAVPAVLEASVDSVIDGLAYIEDDDFDPEILAIFLEEADELMEELDAAVHSWEGAWDNPDAVETMTRALHTFKGGARLCDLKSLGELTHEYESYLLSKEGPEGTPDFFEMLHKYQDLVLKSVKAVHMNFDGESAPVLPLKAVLPVSGEELAVEPEADDSAVIPVVEEVIIEEGIVEQAIPVVTDEVAEDTAIESTEPLAPEDNLLSALESAKSADVIAFKKKDQAVPVVSEDGGFVVAQAGEKKKPKKSAAKVQSQDMVKVSAELLEEMVNLAGETSISRGRLEQQVNDLSGAVDDIDGTLGRLNEQLRRLDIETEAQVLFRQEQMAEHEQFDPLEMDRYSNLQQLTRSLMESASDLMDLKTTLGDKIRGTETLLLQQSRINSSLQEGLMRSRMVPFSRMVPRLRRIVRQVSGELGKNISFDLDNVEGEMDRSVLERMIAPLEHMLRNAVDHGIESPEDRIAANKPETGRILLSLAREGGDILLRLADDGNGVNLTRVRQKAIDKGLIEEDQDVTEHDIMQFILEAGFSTAENVTQISGRGVGMDVVAGEIKQLGGSIVIDSKEGVGTQFTIRLPFTVSVNRALMVQLGQETFAIPLNTIEGIVRVSPFELEHYYSNPDARFEYAEEHYKVRHLGSMLNNRIQPKLDGQVLPLPVILVRSAQNTMALQVDSLQGSREIVVKSLGPQFATVQALSGATVTGDGTVVVILDPHAIVRKEMVEGGSRALVDDVDVESEEDRTKVIMVVDDSVTVRKVTTRFLERQGYNVITAKDGIDALQVLETETPDLMLLDIEMPRMDGFEVAKNVRATQKTKSLPIIMITSRTGDKHRQHALSIGVNDYVGKPYQEKALLEIMESLLAERSKAATQT